MGPWLRLVAVVSLAMGVSSCGGASGGGSGATGSAYAVPAAPAGAAAAVAAAVPGSAAGTGAGGIASPMPIVEAANSVRLTTSALPAVSIGPLVFADNFTSYPPGSSAGGWSTSGTWNVCRPNGAPKNEYCATSPGGGVATPQFAGAASHTNYHVDAGLIRNNPGTESGMAILARMRDATHFYQFEIRNDTAGSGKDFWYIWKSDGGIWTRLNGGAFAAHSPPFYSIRFDLNGSSLAAYVSYDRVNPTYTALGGATDASYTAGPVALRSWGSGLASFGYMSVGLDRPPPANATDADSRLTVAAGLYVQAIGYVASPRELALDPAGNLIVGTSNKTVWIVPDADDTGVAGTPALLLTLPEGSAEGIALGNGALYVGTYTSVWKAPYAFGIVGTPSKIVAVRTGPVAPNSDGDVHASTSVAAGPTTLYISVGSSCNACTEVDPTRGVILSTPLAGGSPTTVATRVRNAIAVAINPATGTLWAGGAGQDDLPQGHPDEYFDAVTLHATPADYGWPDCEEDRIAYVAGSNCTGVVIPRVEFPAYQTLIGAAFYSPAQAGTYAFPAAYRGGAFVSMHGSWHAQNGIPVAPPRVAYVPMSGDTPATAVNWTNPATQWSDVLSGFQLANGARWDRSTGIAVGPQGSLFIAGDSGTIYRIRPGTRP